MTITLDPIRLGTQAPRARTVLALPGLAEQVLVVVTTFILLHEVPESWVRDRFDREAAYSNPTLVLIELALIAVAVVRVVGSIDHLLTMIKAEAALYAFAGLTFASLFWSADPTLTFRRSIVFLSVTAYGSYLVIRFPLDRIMLLLATMAVPSAALNLFFVFALPRYGVDFQGHWTGVFFQKNSLGYAAALAIPTLIMAGRANPRPRWIFYTAAVAHAVLLVGSRSKTMLVATVLPVALMGLYQGFRGRKTLRGAVLVGLGGSAALAAAFATANIGLLARWLDKDVTLTGRVPLWQNLIPIGMQSPVLGHGYGATFNGFFSPVHEIWILNRWNPSHAHDALLQIWLEVGLVGVALFCFIYARTTARAIRIVAIVPGAVGLWPLVFVTTTLMVSITESGVTSEPLGWMLFCVTVLSCSFHLRYRQAAGLSNDLRAAIEARARAQALARSGRRAAPTHL